MNLINTYVNVLKYLTKIYQFPQTKFTVLFPDSKLPKYLIYAKTTMEIPLFLTFMTLLVHFLRKGKK